MKKPNNTKEALPVQKTNTAVTTAVTTIAPPGMEDVLLQDAGLGLQDMGRDDLAIPRLTILQALSPQVQSRDPEYVEGAEAGDVYDNIMSRVISGDKGFQAIVVSYRKAFLEWVPRNKGGGFVADHGDNPGVLSNCKQENGRFVNPAGNEIAQTAEYFLLVLEEDGSARQAVISLSSSQLKHSRRLNTLMATYQIPHPTAAGKKIQAPIFYRTYNFATGPEKNEKGTWFGWVFTPGVDTLTLPGGTDLYMLARSFRQQVAEGRVKVAEHAAPVSTDGAEAF